MGEHTLHPACPVMKHARPMRSHSGSGASRSRLWTLSVSLLYRMSISLIHGSSEMQLKKSSLKISATTVWKCAFRTIDYGPSIGNGSFHSTQSVSRLILYTTLRASHSKPQKRHVPLGFCSWRPPFAGRPIEIRSRTSAIFRKISQCSS